ncbi:hypothetical protein JHS3_02160 [Jeongeupia sp. HS-3]|uniref:Spy/CpxP family protein refolding chaperone n=1 Tax=Jeongeupia sp. HS-3 TaxID=1009682 RepID=UPI0018A66E93|nr:Spy/CpxP family protein refolding chaperone [Jeongeupia sp. HS-3]BCL74480.1 hypothetical protein JHS3_02160 [Jeongeupia sp. HS-3]
MKLNRKLISCVAAALMLGTAVVTVAMPLTPEAHGSWSREHRPSAEQWQQRTEARLARMANRLEIKASQQGAWDAYAKSYRETFAQPKMPARADNLDAAATLRQRAAFMNEHAKRTLQLADATETLAKSLTAEQRKVLDEMARRDGHGMHKGMRGHHRGQPPVAPAPQPNAQ